MPKLEVGDVVRIARQPKEMSAQVVNEVGFIESLSPTHAGFVGLNLDGSYSGVGTVALDLLEREISPHWIEAKRLRDEALEKALAESRARTERYNARMFELSVKYKVSVENVKSLLSNVEYLKGRDWWP